MKRQFFLLPFLGLALSGCGVNEMMRALECNLQAVQMSTQTICENVQAIEEANRGIEENIRLLEGINKELSNLGG